MRARLQEVTGRFVDLVYSQFKVCFLFFKEFCTQKIQIIYPVETK